MRFPQIKLLLLAYCCLQTIFGCLQQSSSEKEKEIEKMLHEIEVKEKELEERENRINSLNQESNYSNQTQTKNVENSYIYFSVLVKEPSLYHRPEEYMPATLPGMSTFRTQEVNLIDFQDMIYTSDIYEVDNNDENRHYQLLEEFILEVNNELNRKNSIFYSEVNYKVSSASEKNEYLKIKCEILDNKIKKFSSYKDASINKSKNSDKFE